MRVGVVRTDLQKIYLADVENRSQRCFSSEPPGQSRYFEKPTNASLLNILNTLAPLTLACTNNAATVNTTLGANVLKIRTLASDSFTSISVVSNAAATKVQIVSDLNAAFVSNSLPFVARIQSGANRIRIDTSGLNLGPSARLEIDTVAGGSTLNAVIGTPSTPAGDVLTGLSLGSLTGAIYPTSVTIDVSSSNILGLSTFADLTTTAQDALVDAIADLVAPSLVETGPVLLSFVYGYLSKLSSNTFQPGGARVGLPAGPAVAIVEDDGSTPFVV